MPSQLSQDLASLRIAREAPPPRRAWRTAILVIAVLGLAAGTFVYAKPAVEARIFQPEVDVTEISTISPAQGSVDVTSTGYVIAQSVAKVGANVVGRVTKVTVREGSRVKAGDLLFEIDRVNQNAAISSARARTVAARARARAAKAAVTEANQQWERQKKLLKSGAGLAATAEDLGARVDALREQAKAADAEASAAQAEVNALQEQLVHFTIVAPIDGVVQTKPAMLGDVVGPSFPLVEIVDPTSLLVETDVPEGRLHLVKDDGPCEIVLEATPGKRYRGTVVDISPKMNRAKATAVVKVRFDDKPERLVPEMSARVSFLARALDEQALKEKPKIVVPASAVIDRSGGKAVFVLDDGKVKLSLVTVGEELGTGFELLEGPPPGTRVVKDPPKDLTDGQSVKEKEKSS
jgi:RND family efflux transporter MFP subunit